MSGQAVQRCSNGSAKSSLSLCLSLYVFLSLSLYLPLSDSFVICGATCEYRDRVKCSATKRDARVWYICMYIDEVIGQGE